MIEFLLRHEEIAAAIIVIIASGMVAYFTIMWSVSRMAARGEALEKRIDNLERDFKETIIRMECKMDAHFKSVIEILTRK